MCYYWYHHGMISAAEREEIENAIMAHDYERFSAFAEKYNKIGSARGWGERSFFPDKIWDEKTEKCIPLKANYDRITRTECECG